MEYLSVRHGFICNPRYRHYYHIEAHLSHKRIHLSRKYCNTSLFPNEATEYAYLIQLRNNVLEAVNDIVYCAQ